MTIELTKDTDVHFTSWKNGDSEGGQTTQEWTSTAGEFISAVLEEDDDDCQIYAEYEKDNLTEAECYWNVEEFDYPAGWTHPFHSAPINVQLDYCIERYEDAYARSLRYHTNNLN